VDWTSVIEIAAGAFLGALTGAYFARRGSRELRQEADSLRHLITLILRGLDEAGLVEYKQDERGVPESIHFKRLVSDDVSVSDSVSAKLRREDAPPEQE
jgi:hypothetical protein